MNPIIALFLLGAVGSAVVGAVSDHTCTMQGSCSKGTLVGLDKTQNPTIPVLNNCIALCRNDFASTCRGGVYNENTRKCYLYDDKCTSTSDSDFVDDGSTHLVYFYRKQADGDDCTSGSSLYWVRSPWNDYGGRFCYQKGKDCTGADMYGNQPWKVQTKGFCLHKSARIVTSITVVWVPDAGQTADDEDATGTCYHKITGCDDAALVTATNADTYVFDRQLKVDDGCRTGFTYYGTCTNDLYGCWSFDSAKEIETSYSYSSNTACQARCVALGCAYNQWHAWNNECRSYKLGACTTALSSHYDFWTYIHGKDYTTSADGVCPST